MGEKRIIKKKEGRRRGKINEVEGDGKAAW